MSSLAWDWQHFGTPNFHFWPFLALFLIGGLKVTIVFICNNNTNNFAASGTRENWFRLGEEFEFEYGDQVKGVKHKVCQMDEENVLLW